MNEENAYEGINNKRSVCIYQKKKKTYTKEKIPKKKDYY